MKFQIEVTALVELSYDSAQFPTGMSANDALALKVEELSKDPREILAMEPKVVGVNGFVLGSGESTSPISELAAAYHQVRAWDY